MINVKDLDLIRRLCNNLEKIFKPLNETICKQCNGRCCSHCGNGNGYFNWHKPLEYKKGIVSWFDKRELLLLKILKAEYGFNKRDGFLDVKNKCCKLPMYRRSWLCLQYSCLKLIPDKKIKNKIKGICKIIKNIRIKNHELI